MNEYEVIIEEINPCGGETYARKEIIEVEADSPESYVRANARFPIMEISEKDDGTTLIIAGNDCGYITRYTFSEPF